MEQAPYTPRLACVKPAASVHPEPGSNSSSYIVWIDKSILCFNKRESKAVFFYSLIKILLSLICCQFNMSMNVSSFVFRFKAFGFLAGCKHKMFFRFSQMFFFNFFSFEKLFKNSFVNLKTQRTYSLLRVQKYTVYWVIQGLFAFIFWLFSNTLVIRRLQIAFYSSFLWVYRDYLNFLGFT